MTLQSTKEAWYLGSIVFSKKARNVTVSSSNPRVATVKTVKQSSDTIQIMVTPKKLGTTVITTKVSGKTYKNKVAIKNYVNPISSVKLGNTTISGSKFNKKDAYNFKFSGWYLNGVTEKISNSNNLNYLDPDIKTFKVRSKKGSYSLILNFYNEKQHSNENVVLNFK